jgi:hypothetical protein
MAQNEDKWGKSEANTISKSRYMSGISKQSNLDKWASYAKQNSLVTTRLNARTNLLLPVATMLRMIGLMIGVSRRGKRKVVAGLISILPPNPIPIPVRVEASVSAYPTVL